MFTRKKDHSWYWHTLGLLLFCMIMFGVAKSFMKAAIKMGNPKVKKKKGKDDDPLFI